MAQKKFTELPAATAPLTGTEVVALVQGGTSKRTTTQDIADLGGGSGAVDSVNGQTGLVVLDAGDIGNTPAGSIAATDVQGAINELDTEKATTGSVTTVATDLSNHIADATAAHAASAISNTPAGTISATTVQAAIDEIDADMTAAQQFDTVNAQTGTSYTAVLTDADNSTLVTMDNANPNNFVIPTNASVAYPVGKILFVEQIGDGVTSIVPFDGTVTVTYSAGVSAVAGKNTLNAAFKTGTNAWTVWNGTPPQSTGTLTKTNGTYITITLSGTPTDALLEDVNITADITTAIAVALGGTGLTSIAAGDYLWGSATNTISAKNAFATTQTAYIHLKAGTATASTAPLKLTTGTVNTTAEAGAIEYTTPQLFFTNGGARRQEIPQIQQSRVSTQFDATSNTTLANVTGLTATLVASRIYRFEATLYTASNIAGGVKFAIAGTATATNIIYECVVIDSNVNAAQTRATALATAVGGVTAVTVAYAKITGTITVNAAGTLTVQFAQNASNGSASSVLVGSTFVLTEMA